MPRFMQQSGIHFARGQSQTTITVQTTNDTVDDSGEVFEVTLVEGMESDRSSLKQAVFKTGPGATLEYTTRRAYSSPHFTIK